MDASWPAWRRSWLAAGISALALLAAGPAAGQGGASPCEAALDGLAYRCTPLDVTEFSGGARFGWALQGIFAPRMAAGREVVYTYRPEEISRILETGNEAPDTRFVAIWESAPGGPRAFLVEPVSAAADAGLAPAVSAITGTGAAIGVPQQLWGLSPRDVYLTSPATGR